MSRMRDRREGCPRLVMSRSSFVSRLPMAPRVIVGLAHRICVKARLFVRSSWSGTHRRYGVRRYPPVRRLFRVSSLMYLSRMRADNIASGRRARTLSE